MSVKFMSRFLTAWPAESSHRMTVPFFARKSRERGAMSWKSTEAPPLRAVATVGVAPLGGGGTRPCVAPGVVGNRDSCFHARPMVTDALATLGGPGVPAASTEASVAAFVRTVPGATPASTRAVIEKACAPFVRFANAYVGNPVIAGIVEDVSATNARPTGSVSLTQTVLAGRVPVLFTNRVNVRRSFGWALVGATVIARVTFASSSRPYATNRRSVGVAGFVQPTPRFVIALPAKYTSAPVWRTSYAWLRAPVLAATIQYRTPLASVGVGVKGTETGPTDVAAWGVDHASAVPRGTPPASVWIVTLTVFPALPRFRSRRVRFSRMYVVEGVKDCATLSPDQTRKMESLPTTVFAS